jgi:hypothetical protein
MEAKVQVQDKNSSSISDESNQNFTSSLVPQIAQNPNPQRGFYTYAQMGGGQMPYM